MSIELYFWEILLYVSVDYRSKALTVVFLGVLELGVFRSGLTRLDGPLIQIFLQAHQPTVWQNRVAAVRVWPLAVRHAGVSVVVRQQVVLCRCVDGAVDGTVVGRRAAFSRLVRIANDPKSWTSKERVTPKSQTWNFRLFYYWKSLQL